MKTVSISNLTAKIPTRTPKWCKVCLRKHNRFESCGLEVVTRSAKSGREVTRLTLPKES